jgi:Protein of unknown function (DUF2800)
MEHGNRKHALLSASGASRWLNCTPSPRLEENFTEVRSSYADEGTLAHELSEVILRQTLGGISLQEALPLLEKIEKSEYYSDEMYDEVSKYTSYVLESFNDSLSKTQGAKLLIEEKVDLTEFIEEGYGTNDAIILADKTLKVFDLKYGKGIRVNAENNSQLSLYGLGALYKYMFSYDIQEIELNIVQPRIDNFSSWTISTKDLLEWAENEVKPKAKMAYKGEGIKQVGDWCKFCKAKVRCKAIAKKSMEAAQIEFGDALEERVPAFDSLSDKELIYLFNNADQIKDWVNSVEAYMLKEAVAGKDWEELKLVEGRSRRTWLDEEKVKEKLLEEGYEIEKITSTKLEGITKIEKLLGKKGFDILSNLVTKPFGAPTLVDAGDKRPVYSVASAEEDFKD